MLLEVCCPPVLTGCYSIDDGKILLKSLPNQFIKLGFTLKGSQSDGLNK